MKFHKCYINIAVLIPLSSRCQQATDGFCCDHNRFSVDGVETVIWDGPIVTTKCSNFQSDKPPCNVYNSKSTEPIELKFKHNIRVGPVERGP